MALKYAYEKSCSTADLHPVILVFRFPPEVLSCFRFLDLEDMPCSGMELLPEQRNALSDRQLGVAAFHRGAVLDWTKLDKTNLVQ